MPEPKRSETLTGFVERYMGSKEARKSFPKQKQRAAVAYAEYKRKKRS